MRHIIKRLMPKLVMMSEVCKSPSRRTWRPHFTSFHSIGEEAFHKQAQLGSATSYAFQYTSISPQQVDHVHITFCSGKRKEAPLSFPDLLSSTGSLSAVGWYSFKAALKDQTSVACAPSIDVFQRSTQKEGSHGWRQE